MASVFAQLIDELRVKFDEVRLERGRGAFKEWLVGRNAVQQHKAIPYIGWVRTDGQAAKPPNSNQIIHDGLSITPRYILEQNVICLICGRDDEETESLLFEVLEAEHLAFGHTTQPGKNRWPTQEEDQAGLVLAGAELVVQEFTWPLIVPREIKRLTTITGSTHECSLDGSNPDD